jgi:hypothetical protein
MTSDDRDRAALVRAAAESWGEEAAATLSELLPPSGDRPATKRDIDGVLAAMNAMDDRYEARFAQMDAGFAQMDAGFARMDAGFARMDAGFARMETRFARMETRFARMETRFGQRLDERLDATVDRITAAFERRISDAVTTQTRTLVFSQLAALVVIAALAFGLR